MTDSSKETHLKRDRFEWKKRCYASNNGPDWMNVLDSGQWGFTTGAETVQADWNCFSVCLRIILISTKDISWGRLQMGKLWFGLVAVGQAVKNNVQPSQRWLNKCVCVCVTWTHLMGGSSVSAELYLLRDSSRFPVANTPHSERF